MGARVRAYPVGIDCAHDALQTVPFRQLRRVAQRVCRELETCRLVFGWASAIDRMDYTKGINEKFLAIERLLEMHSGVQRTLRVRAGR